MVRKSVLTTLLIGLVLVPAMVSAEGAPAGLTGGRLADSNASFLGGSGDEGLGYSVASAGDVNGDGFADLLLGDPYYDEGGNNDLGKVYLFLGGPGGWQIDEPVANADASYTGELGERAGYSVDGAGDVNNDGFDDILIGAPGFNGDVGRALLIYGNPGIAGNLGPDQVFDPAFDPGTLLGSSVSGAGDVNGDGRDDFLIGAPGWLASTGLVTLWYWHVPSGSFVGALYQGANGGDGVGSSIAGPGDVNGDGYADLLIGASAFNSDTGRSYLVLGASSPPNGILESMAYRTYDGEWAGDQAGSCVAGAGDVNGDGFADFLVGSPSFDGGGMVDIGKAYLMLGAQVLPSSGALLDVATAAFIGEDTDSLVGTEQSLAGIGDVNGDGYADMIMGGYGFMQNTGRIYVILGSALPRGETQLSYVDAIYTGTYPGDFAGRSVAGAGDVNGDGLGDVLTGAHGYYTVGRAHLILSDYAAAGAARYRRMLVGASIEATYPVGFSGVSVRLSGAEPGSIFVTRHQHNTCGTNFATNGLLWTVESELGGPAVNTLTFHYNGRQITDWPEDELRLYFRDRPCQDWIEDDGATLNMDLNRIVSGPVMDAHREYTIAPSQPSPTALNAMSARVTLAKEPLWLVMAVAALVIVSAAATWWQRHADQGTGA